MRNAKSLYSMGIPEATFWLIEWLFDFSTGKQIVNAGYAKEGPGAAAEGYYQYSEDIYEPEAGYQEQDNSAHYDEQSQEKYQEEQYEQEYQPVQYEEQQYPEQQQYYEEQQYEEQVSMEHG